MVKTLETLKEVTGPDQCPLPSSELYIMVHGEPSKEKVIWRTIVNVDAVKAAVRNLKQINWLYRKADEQSVDDVTKQVIETIDTTISTMLVKTTKEEVSEFQSYTTRTLNKQLSTTSDIEQYKLLSAKEDPLGNHQQFVDVHNVLCFLVLFLRGRLGEFHPCSVKISSSEYAKSRLLNKDS